MSLNYTFILIIGAMFFAALFYGWVTRHNALPVPLSSETSPPETPPVPFWKTKPTRSEYKFGGTVFSLLSCAAITLFAFQADQPSTSYRWMLSLAVAIVSILVALMCLIGYTNSTSNPSQELITHDPTRPIPPPAKSKRLTAADRRSREFRRRYGPAGIALFAWICQPFTPTIFGVYWIPGIVIIPLITLVGTAMWNSQDWVRQSWREEEYEEQRKWAEEDAAWANYEREVKLWEERQQYQAGVQTDHHGISEIARKIVAERQRGNP